MDVSTASEYYRRHWETVLPRVRGQLRERNRFHYELNKQFFHFFIGHLREVIVQHYGRSEMGAGDFVANALYRAGWLFGMPKKPAFDRLETIRLWPVSRPVSEAWKNLGSLAIPGGSWVTLEDPGSGCELRLPQPGRFDHPRIGINITWAQDKKELPKVTIEIEGEPVCTLMRARYELEDPYERREVRKKAKRTWDSLIKQLYAMVGVGHLKRGRPQEHRIGRAAYLKYHRRLTWREVAQELCPENHAHTKDCRERFQRGVDQLWKRHSRNARSLPAVRT